MTRTYKLEGALAEEVVKGMEDKGVAKKDAETVVHLAARFQRLVDKVFEKELLLAAYEAGIEMKGVRKYTPTGRDIADVMSGRSPEADRQEKEDPRAELFDKVLEAVSLTIIRKGFIRPRPMDMEEMRGLVAPLINTLQNIAKAEAKRPFTTVESLLYRTVERGTRDNDKGI